MRNLEKNFGYIQITRKCNRDCIFCSNPRNDNELTFEEAKNQIDEYVKIGVNEIIFTGGEPTLNENLQDLIKYCNSINLDCRIITNAQKLAEINYAKKLSRAGLNNLIISIYSHIKVIEEKLTKTQGSYEKTVKGIKNAIKYIHPPHINITINSLNRDHLSDLIKFLIQNFPEIKHFVFNNLDPTGRALQNKWTIPRLVDIEFELHKALICLKKNNKTFRVERVPLCYMPGFEEFSTETRKIVKNQSYRCLFLNEKNRELREVSNFYAVKSPVCKVCSLNTICAGLNPRYVKMFGCGELFPVFENKKAIIRKIIEF